MRVSRCDSISSGLADADAGTAIVVIANIFKGDQSGFVREDEVIASWEIFTP